MDTNDRQAIEGLFTKLDTVERQGGQRDAEAERFISDRVRQQPSAPYLMAQTIVMQEMALENQQREIEALREQASRPQASSGGGGFLSRMFGGDTPAARPAVPTQGQYGAAAGGAWGARPGQAPAHGQPGGMPMGGAGGMMGGRGGGGGFLAGAAQTAMGVAGGVLLGNALGSMFAGDAQAAEAPAETPAEETGGIEETAAEDGGGFFDGGGFDEEI